MGSTKYLPGSGKNDLHTQFYDSTTTRKIGTVYEDPTGFPQWTVSLIVENTDELYERAQKLGAQPYFFNAPLFLRDGSKIASLKEPKGIDLLFLTQENDKI